MELWVLTLDSRQWSHRRDHLHKRRYNQSDKMRHNMVLSGYSQRVRTQRLPSEDPGERKQHWWRRKSPKVRLMLGSLLETMLRPMFVRPFRRDLREGKTNELAQKWGEKEAVGPLLSADGLAFSC